MKVYTSNLPRMIVPERSIFTHLFPDKEPYPGSTPAFIDAETGRTVTREQLRTLSLQLGWSMRNNLQKLGGPLLKRGDTVMVFSPNSIAFPIAMFGSIAAGLRATLANSAYTPSELAHQWTDSCAKVVFVHPALIKTVTDMFKLLKVGFKEARSRIIILGFGLDNKGPSGFLQMEKLFGKGQLVQEEKFDGELSNETCLLCYSSGTTGKPKGVEVRIYTRTCLCMLSDYQQSTHKNMVAVLTIAQPYLTVFYNKDITLAILPFFHIFGAVNILQFPIQQGVPVVVMTRFEPVAFCQNIEKFKITFALIVPPVLVVLARHPGE